jgi:hypothetical protein
VSVCLTDTIRSQSFSLSQRFNPARASWLCFAPHPPIGFRSSELFPLGQPWHLSVLAALMPFQPARVSLELPRTPPSPLSDGCPCATSRSPEGERRVYRCNSNGESRHQPDPRFTEVDQGPGERPRPPTEREHQAHAATLPGLRKAGWSSTDRLVPTTTERCSDRESVLDRWRLSERTSRCSHDLFPLRGLPIRPLGSRPPLMCLLRRGSRHLAVPWPVVSRHFRVSIRLDLGVTPKTDPNLLGVCNLFRSPEALQLSRANP